MAEKISRQKMAELAKMVGMSLKEYEAMLNESKETAALAKAEDEQWKKEIARKKLFADGQTPKPFKHGHQNKQAEGTQNSDLNLPEDYKETADYSEYKRSQK